MSAHPCTEARESANRPSPDPKRFNNLQARFARIGWALDPLHGQKLLLQRWGAHRVLSDLDEAERALAQIGGAT